MPRLSDTTIRNLKPGPRQMFYRDETVRGFGIRVSPKGTKTFVLMHGADRRLTTIGRYGIITLQEARLAAKKMLPERTLGRYTPLTATFREAFSVYVATHLPNNRTAYESERVLTKHVLPALQSKKLTEIHYQHVAEIIDRIKTKPAANHLYTETRVFFNWAVKRRYLTLFPLAGSTQPHPSVNRERVLTHDELRRIWHAAAEIGYRYGTIVQLLMLTGQRRGETSKLEWDYIKGDQISFPAAIVKNKRTHTIPIGSMAVNVIENIERRSPMLFPAEGHDDRPFAAWSSAFLRLEALSGCSNFTLHDLRRTFATELASLGVAIHVIEKLLNHSSGQISGVAAIYNRFSYAKEMRVAILLWENHLAKIVTNKVAANAA
jgi:integrase